MNIFPVHVCLLIGNMSAAEDRTTSKSMCLGVDIL